MKVAFVVVLLRLQERVLAFKTAAPRCMTAHLRLML